MSSFSERLNAALEGEYEVERELGHGTSATVYLARSVKHDRPVALKVLRSEFTAIFGTSRFLREIEVAAKLTHPHILPLLDSNESQGVLYYVTPFIAGESLRERLERDGTLSIEEAIRFTTETAAALNYAHAAGVIHRDIKPENILLQDDRVVVSDFGISLTVGPTDRKRLTESGLILGTPWYMSPEQASGNAVDARSDIYSLGCVLYELLVGEPPFAGPTPQAVLVRQMVEEPPLLRERLPSASAELEACVTCSLAKDPSKRFATAREFARALEAPLASARVRRRIAQRRARQWGWMAAATLGIVLLVAYVVSMRTPFHAEDWLVVADFEGPPADPSLAIVFRELVTSELNRSHLVSTLSRQQLSVALRDAGLAETTAVNPDLARELAFRSAVRGVVSGVIRPLAENRYRLELRVVDADRGSTILSLNDNSDSRGMLPAIASLASQLRRRLGEQRSSIEADRPLLDIATPSLPAYRKYVEAIALKQRGEMAASNRALEQALSNDTDFASAWALMAMNYIEQRDMDSARMAFAEALRRPARMSDANRYRLKGDVAYAVDYDLQSAVHWYDLFLKQSPHSMGGRNNRGLYLSLLGRREEALEEFSRAASDNPLGPANAQPALTNETSVLISLGRRDRARAVARDLTGPFARFAQLQLANASGDITAAESLAVAPAADPATVGWLRIDAITTLAAVSASRGRLQDADRRLARASAERSGAERRWYFNLRTLLAFVSTQRPEETATPTAADSSPGGLVSRGLRAFIDGDTSLLSHSLALLRGKSRGDSARLGQGLPVLQAMIDMSNGKPAAVITRLTTLARHGDDDGTNLDRLPAAWPRWLVAGAYAKEHRPDSAIAYLRLAIADSGLASGDLAVRAMLVPFARREIARNDELLGRYDEAALEWRALIAAMSQPDRAGARTVNEARRALASRS